MIMTAKVTKHANEESNLFHEILTPENEIIAELMFIFMKMKNQL